MSERIYETEGSITRVYERVEGEHKTYLAKPENYTPPTNNPDDCICGGGKPGATGRTLIANCPCCAGVQSLVWDVCPCGGKHPVMTIVASPETALRLRYIDSVEAIK
jgi:hypothetical protein